MAFTGTPVIKIVSDQLVRITGIGFVGAPQNGTIALFENAGAPDIRLPAAFRPRVYSGADDQLVSLQDSVQVIVSSPSSGGAPVPDNVKTGTDASDFEVLINAFNPVADLEIYIRFH